ncbi:hypothetical protein E2C01_035085 [Portunus trituberculatus]|uniref:Uncharacterized protein n=1 Tax=Portunus trituberculatus TaxID=210409 RepID=A0A5B7F4M2_PORTR|nr:hypothetical protein [Portunus trituberculatus]
MPADQVTRALQCGVPGGATHQQQMWCHYHTRSLRTTALRRVLSPGNATLPISFVQNITVPPTRPRERDEEIKLEKMLISKSICLPHERALDEIHTFQSSLTQTQRSNYMGHLLESDDVTTAPLDTPGEERKR